MVASHSPPPLSSLLRPPPQRGRVLSTVPWQSGRPSLKLLAERILGLQVQEAEHCSVSVLGQQSSGLGAIPDLAAKALSWDPDNLFLGGRWSIKDETAPRAYRAVVKFRVLANTENCHVVHSPQEKKAPI